MTEAVERELSSVTFPCSRLPFGGAEFRRHLVQPLVAHGRSQLRVFYLLLLLGVSQHGTCERGEERIELRIT